MNGTIHWVCVADAVLVAILAAYAGWRIGMKRSR